MSDDDITAPQASFCDRRAESVRDQRGLGQSGPQIPSEAPISASEVQLQSETFQTFHYDGPAPYEL